MTPFVLQSRSRRVAAQLCAPLLALGVWLAVASPCQAEPLRLPDRGGPAAADRAARSDRSGVPSRPELVRVVWTASTRPPKQLSHNVDGTTIGVSGVVELAESALKYAFGQAAAAFSPPVPLRLQIKRFDVQRTKTSFVFLLDTVAIDDRDGQILYRDRGESACRIAPGMNDAELDRCVTRALRELADEASERMLNREFRVLGDAEQPLRRFWLGMGGGGKLVATVQGTAHLDDSWAIELEVAPIAPRYGALLRGTKEVYRASDLAFGVGGGLGRALAASLIELCNPDREVCRALDATTWGQVDAHLYWFLGVQQRHRVGISAAALYFTNDTRIGIEGDRGADATFAVSYQYGL